MTKIETRELTPELWPALEELFGSNGACGGCWCMTWRLEKGEKWDGIKGRVAKQRFRKLVITGKAHGFSRFPMLNPSAGAHSTNAPITQSWIERPA